MLLTQEDNGDAAAHLNAVVNVPTTSTSGEELSKIKEKEKENNNVTTDSSTKSSVGTSSKHQGRWVIAQLKENNSTGKRSNDVIVESSEEYDVYNG